MKFVSLKLGKHEAIDFHEMRHFLQKRFSKCSAVVNFIICCYFRK